MTTMSMKMVVEGLSGGNNKENNNGGWHCWIIDSKLL
jgi:hypothetical protein